MADFHIGRFVPDDAGIIATWKSGGMQGALAEVAGAKCAEANSEGHLHGPHGDLYTSGVHVLDRTAVGHVTTNGYLGKVDQAYHHTLDSINH